MSALRYQTKKMRLALRSWLQANSYAPRWLPKRWRHPLAGYCVAVLVEFIAASLTILSIHHLPVFALQGALVMLGIVLVALNCGAGPGLLATLIGTTLLEFVVLPAYFPWFLNNATAALCISAFLLVGFSISLIAGQSGWARRQAEALTYSLREEQARTEVERQRLRTLLDVLPAAVGMMDTQARTLETNPASKALWGEGAPRPGEIGQPQAWHGWWPDTGKPLDPGEWAITRAFRGETTINQEVEFETSDGQRKVILDSAAPIRDESGAIIGGAGIHQDITERKRLEEALRESERQAAERAAQLETIFESITDGLIVTDSQGRIFHMNQAIRTLLGIEFDPTGISMPGLEAMAGFSASNAEGLPLTEAERPLNRYLQGEVLTRQESVDLILQTRDGRETLLNNTGAPIRDATGQVIGAVEAVRDVTEQRRLEQQTRENLSALLAMAEELVQAPDQAYVAGKCAGAEANPVAWRLAELTCSVLGCQHVSIAAVDPGTEALTPITVVGLSPDQEQCWWASWNPQHHFGTGLQPTSIAALRAGEPVLLDNAQSPTPFWQHITPERASLMVPMRVGETLVGLLKINCGQGREGYDDPNKQALVRAVARLGALVLERERLLCERAEARASELALREANTQMDTFLGMAGHELKTPLTTMKLSLQLAERRTRQLIQREQGAARELAPFLEHFGRAVHQAERLDRLVNDLVDVSRVRAGKLELHPEPADLAAIVRDMVEEQRQAAPTRALGMQLPDDLRIPVTADADRIGQVVTNYLTNALKYSAADCPVEVGTTVDAHQARVWVRDHGPGLPAEEQAQIWERFHRAKGVKVQSGTGIGLGLGLHICRTIIQRHQGQVGVESTPGKGSTFWFTLPLDRMI